MNADKRKRDDRGELEGKRARADGGERNGGHEMVTEEEVEEFFAILRRIHVAAKHLGRAASMEWRPSFQVEDFKEDNESLMIKDQKKEEKQTEAEAKVDSGLDLNSHPV
ncbi:protein NIM1-INTERACTING 2-like [Pyrus ussuriensis x Pyrus communis]|uniref:Protein NIM1-INTERACTING 2-like n=1 Tax=Pyrus ussuriensis x Pyrus communis TaxID=2448454 RepID=A0A5N5H8G5_9ROSA|nr:protein NIM1-INTERACTING 2-like [Pyrus ussuriensis x Pyrus communis]